MTRLEAQLREEALAAKMLIEALAQAGEDDEESIELTIASETNLNEAVEQALDVALHANAMCNAIGDRIDALKARQARLAARAERIRGLILTAMEMSGQRKLELPEATISVKPSPASVIVTSEDLIPDEWWKVETVRKLDKRRLSEALKNGISVEGAVLSNAYPSLSVRTK